MEHFWEVLKPSGHCSATGIISFHLILVFLRVSSQCFEEDCKQNQSIRVVNATTRECITCFPCLVCTDSTPSVPCGSTVPYGTDIHCAQATHRDPSPVSKASAQYATSEILTSVVTSPSISTRHRSRFTSTKQIMSESVTSNSHPLVVSAIITKASAVSSPSTVNFGSTKTDEPWKTQDSLTKDGQTVGGNGKNFIIIVTFPIVLTVAIINVCIVYRLRKIKSMPGNACNSPSSSRVSLTQQNGDICTVDAVTSSAVFSHARPKDVKQEIKKGKDNKRFQHDQMYDVDSYKITETIPLSLDQGNQSIGDSRSDGDFLVDITPDPPVNSQHHTVLQPPMQTHFNPPGSFQTSATRGWIAGDSNHQGPATVKWSALSQEDKYKTKMQEAPFRLQHNICLELDIRRSDGTDVRLFAEKMGIKTKEFERLQQSASIQKTTATSVILKERFSGSVGDFVYIMEDMERGDIINLINE